jgi:N-acetylneuraminic acid mutarotase
LQNQNGTYGTKGTPAAGNVPGARDSAVSWTDTSGNLWLFGGEGDDSVGTYGELNDLWKYSIASKQWTWVSGSNVAQPIGAYGTEGTPAANNVPGGRYSPVSWTDASGNLWLFGGYGLDSVLADGQNGLNDLWKYDITSNQWTWVSGSNFGGQNGTYGTEGTPAAGNVPGARNGAVSWADTSGNLWLFGGFGFDSAGTPNYMNDLWKYNITSNQWTWVSGSNIGGLNGTYGTLGTPVSSNVPGARYASVSWADASGNLWLFGGVGFDSVLSDGLGDLNDLWIYNVANNQWTWMSGSNFNLQTGTYGTQGTPAPGDVPGSRDSGVSWTDESGNFWLFGGESSAGAFNDLWMYTP